MIEFNAKKPLKEQISYFIQEIQDFHDFYLHNEEVLDIYDGNLYPYVEDLMKETLDARYFKLIQHRILPINFIQKVVDKLARSYGDAPLRQSASSQEFIDFYVDKLDLNYNMMAAEEYSYLNKGYALKPKLTDKGRLKMDVLPYDKFLVLSSDKSDPMTPEVFIEFLGKTEREIVTDTKKEVIEMDTYIAYSDTEIIGFDETGAWMPEVAEELGYINPVGMIPFVYGNRSRSSLVPKQDADFLKLSKALPLMLSDINGALMFQCFTLIYGIDIEFKDAKMSPNAIWELSSKAKSDNQGSIGTLQPTVDSDKALTWFKNVLAMWLDSKGIDASSITKLDSQDIASGFSKAMDELDTTEARKKSIIKLAKEERHLFLLLARLNDFWSKLPQARVSGIKFPKVDLKKLEEDLSIEFKEPMPKLDYTSEIRNSIEMINNGLSYREKEITRLHPYASEEEINQIFYEYGEKRQEVGSKDVADAVDPKKEEIQPPANVNPMENMNNENEDMDLEEDPEDINENTEE
jgi:hypothetical protein